MRMVEQEVGADRVVVAVRTIVVKDVGLWDGGLAGSQWQAGAHGRNMGRGSFLRSAG